MGSNGSKERHGVARPYGGLSLCAERLAISSYNVESRTDVLIARMTSSRLRDYEIRNVKMAHDDRCSR